ncbi:hypothetical protein [Caulobacter sp. 602-1]|nr:hypothetical protein [Caulobacter sp. 602-1]
MSRWRGADPLHRRSAVPLPHEGRREYRSL